MLRARFHFVFYVVFNLISGVSLAQRLPADAVGDNCATAVVRRIYLKHHNRVERTGGNDDSLIYALNRWGNLPLTAPYCGTSIGFFVEQSGLKLVGITKAAMPLAWNWRKSEYIVWDARNGWRSKGRQLPACDEIFVVLFRRSDGGYHVGVALWFHGGLNFITGQGNTSNWRARAGGKSDVNAVGTSLSFRNGTLYLPPKTYNSGRNKGLRQQGFFVKETYQQGNVIAIMAFRTTLK